MGTIAKNHPEARDECISRLGAQLERFSSESRELNAFVVCELMDLRAVELAPLTEQAFAADRVDETVCGDWEDVAIVLGLKSERERPRKPNRLTEFRDKLIATGIGDRFFYPGESEEAFDRPPVPTIAPPKIGRNDPCPCGSENKFKKCCGR